MGYLARQRRSHLYWQITFSVLAILAIYYIFRELQDAAVPLRLSFLLAYLLDPVIDWLEARGINRTLGVVMLLLGVAGVVALFAIFVIPLIVREFATFAKQVPHYIGRIKDSAIPWIEQTFNVKAPTSISEFAERFGYSLRELAQEAIRPLGGMAGRAVLGAYRLLLVLGGLILIPFFTFFFLRDFDKIAAVVVGLIPVRHRPWFKETYRDLDKALSGWIRGQLLVMLILGTLYSIGYVLVGIPLGLVIGILTGLMAFIPYLGATIGFVLALAMAFLDWQGWGPVLGVVGVFGVVQTLDGLFITPNVLGHQTGMSPAVVVLALMVFGKLFGLVGVLLAVPMAAVINVMVRRAAQAYRESAFYTADAPDGTRPVPTVPPVQPSHTEGEPTPPRSTDPKPGKKDSTPSGS